MVACLLLTERKQQKGPDTCKGPMKRTCVPGRTSAQAQRPSGAGAGLSARAQGPPPACACAESRGGGGNERPPGAGLRAAAGAAGRGASVRHAGDGAVRPALGHRQRRLGFSGGLRAVGASAVVRARGRGAGGSGPGPAAGEEGVVCPALASLAPSAARGRGCLRCPRLQAGGPCPASRDGPAARTPGLWGSGAQPGATGARWPPRRRPRDLLPLSQALPPAALQRSARKRTASRVCRTRGWQQYPSCAVPEPGAAESQDRGGLALILQSVESGA